jgi:monoamine oxidase
MRSLGLLPMSEVSTTRLDLAPGVGSGTTVAVLGGGIAGLVSAYAMRNAGFTVTVLEARSRPGGRNWTVRNGTTVDFIDGTRQTAEWSSDSYFNAGPARLPSIHRTILTYCKELGVPLEVEVNTSRSSLLVSDRAFGGRPIEQRQVINDTRGHVAELLAKCIDQHALDSEITADDRERMRTFLRAYGDLNERFEYKGSERAGLARQPGAGANTEELRAPLDMHALLDARLWGGVLFEEALDMQATMFQPVGGMDRIPYAFAAALGPAVRYGAIVKQIRKTETGVTIVFSENGADARLEADYCVCALPVSILKTTTTDFAPRINRAIADTSYADAYKIAWESKRFWETEWNIFGGISWLSDGPIGHAWYPSAKLFSDTGVLVAGYGIERGTSFGKLPSLQAKLAASRQAVERLHPGCGKYLTHPMYVHWTRIAHNLGGWVRFAPDGSSEDGNPEPVEKIVDYYAGPYKEFIEPAGRIYFVGDHCSHMIGWQEGAALSAHRAAQMISDRVRSTKQ